MVLIKDYKKFQDGNGKEFFMLEIEGELEMVKSNQTGKFYATTRSTKIPCTFDEKTCIQFLGKSMQGKIIKIPSEPYEYTVKSTGEVIMLDYKYEYNPDASIEETVLGKSELVI